MGTVIAMPTIASRGQHPDGTRAEPRTSGADAVRTQALMDRLLQAMGLPLEDRPGG